MAVDLGKQVGPLPLGAWVAVVGGGLGIAYYTQRTKAPAAVVADTSGVPGVGEGGSGLWTQLTPPGDSPSSSPVPATNEEWGRSATNYLMAQGYDANVADSAVRKYLGAESLNLQEYALIRFALVKLGAPPVPLPSPPAPPEKPIVPVAPPPPVQTPPPAPVPAKLRFYTVQPGDSLWKIAVKFYGRGSAWFDIYNANRKGYTRPDGSPGFIINPSYLRVGDVLWVPGW